MTKPWNLVTLLTVVRKYSKVHWCRTTVSVASQLFWSPLYLSIQQPHTLNKGQYLADGDVMSIVTCSQEMMAQLPES